jgi:hypothetical protein
MASTTISIFIARPPADVFAYMTDMATKVKVIRTDVDSALLRQAIQTSSEAPGRVRSLDR